MIACVLFTGLSSTEMLQLDQAIRETAASLVDDVIFRAKEMAQRCECTFYYYIHYQITLLQYKFYIYTNKNHNKSQELATSPNVEVSPVHSFNTNLFSLFPSIVQLLTKIHPVFIQTLPFFCSGSFFLSHL